MQTLVATYLRVSTDDQKNSATIENQIKILEDFLKKNSQFKVYKWYKDDGVSGTIPFSDRPVGKQLIEDAKNKKFEIVLVTRTDRFGRSMIGILKAIEILESLNIKFQAILEPYNTSDPAGRYMFNSMANFAEYEINSIRQRMVHGINRAVENHKWPGGVPPLGYTLDKDRHLKVFDDKVIFGIYSEADIVKKIYYLIAVEKMTCERVAQILNDETIPTVSIKNDHLKRKKAKYWIGAGIRQIIKREIYKGIFTFGNNSKDKDRKIPIDVEPIVDKTTWDKAQKTLSENMIKSLRNTKREYLLTGKIRCYLCGRSFTGLSYRGFTYYGCNNFRLKNKNNPTKCKNLLVRADAVENEVWKDILDFIKKPELVKEFIKDKLSDKNEFDAVAEVEKRQKKLEKLSKEKENLVKYIRASGNFMEKDINVEIEKIKNEQVKLNEEISYYNELLKNKELENQKIIEIEKILSKFANLIDNTPFKLKKDIVRLLLNEVIVYPKNLQTKSRDVEISYQFNKDIITKLSLIEL